MLAFLQNGGMCRVVGGLALLPVAMLTGFLHAPVWVWILAVVALPLAVSHAVARIVNRRAFREKEAILDSVNARQHTIAERSQARSRSLSPSVARKDYVREMSALVDDAFDEVDRLARYRWWVKGMEGHIAFLKFGFAWGIYDLAAAAAFVDKMPMPSCILYAPHKMAYLHAKGAPLADIAAVYNAILPAFAPDAATVLAVATYSWILVHEGRLEDAQMVMQEGLLTFENETIRANFKHLLDNRPDLFSNRSLGNAWFDLYLESRQEPRNPWKAPSIHLPAPLAEHRRSRRHARLREREAARTDGAGHETA